MNYYAELRVSEEATREEIRSAYLRLAKEVHPDHVYDADRRASAEPRMIRLNQIMEVLGNEDRRRQYDFELARQRAAQEARVQRALAMQDAELGYRYASPLVARNIIKFLWIGVGAAALLGLAAVFWMPAAAPVRSVWSSAPVAEEQRSSAVSAPPREGGSAPAVSGAARHDTAERPTHAAATSTGRPEPAAQADSALVAEARRALATPVREIESPRIPSHNQPAPPPAATVQVASVAPTPAAPAPPTRSIPSEPARPTPRWVGTWRLSSGTPPGPGTALASDMVMIEASGQIHGAYHGRYTSSGGDPSDVDMQLTPMSYGSEWMRGVWSGNGGAFGQFELKRSGNGMVQMNWWTTKLGDSTKLASGAVRLSERSN